MSGAVYTIRPLRWEKQFCDASQRYVAGHYSIERLREYRDDYDETGEWGVWRMKWNFCEYFDEGSRDVLCPKEGKRLAFEDHLERLIPLLKKVQP